MTFKRRNVKRLSVHAKANNPQCHTLHFRCAANGEGMPLGVGDDGNVEEDVVSGLEVETSRP